MRAALFIAATLLVGCNLFEQTAEPVNPGNMDGGIETDMSPADSGNNATADASTPPVDMRVLADMPGPDLGAPQDQGVTTDDMSVAVDLSGQNCSMETLACDVVGDSGGQCNQSGAGSLIIEAIGEIDDPQDAFMFTRLSVTGDFVVQGKVQAFTDRRRDSVVGLMARQSSDPRSKFAHVHLTDGEGIWFSFREQLFIDEQELNSGPEDAWLRLVREGDMFTGSYSTDGTTWRYVGSETIDMGDELLVGVALASGDDEDRVTAIWSQIEFCQ